MDDGATPLTTHTTRSGVLETVVEDGDILPLAPDNGEEGAPLSKAVMKAYRKAKKATVSKTERDRMIVEDMRMKREGGHAKTKKVHETPSTTQSTLFGI